MLYQPGKETNAPPGERELAAVGALIEDMAKAGLLHDEPAFGSAARAEVGGAAARR